MKSSYLGIVFSSIWIVNCFCSTDFRNVTGTQPTFLGQPRAPKLVWLYPENRNLQIEPHEADNRGYYTNPTPSVSFASVGRSFKVVEPTKLASPQILYDFQRSPVEAAPILGNRPLQLINTSPPGSAQIHKKIPHKNVPNIITSETIVNPLQTSNFFDQNIQHPLYNIQPQYYIPKKYALVNGKFVYDPKSLQLVQKPTLPTAYHSSQQFPQFPHPLAPHKLIPQPVPITRVPPIPQKSHFQAPPVSQFQPINTPSEHPVQTEQHDPTREDEEPTKEVEPTRDTEPVGEEKPIREELTRDEELDRDEEPTREEKPFSENIEEEDNEDNANYEEDDDPEHYEAPEFEKYFNNDEEDHEHIERYDDDDDDDSERGSTSSVPSRKFPKKYNFKPDKKGEIIYGRKNERNGKSSQKPKNKEKMHYKSYRYSKDSAEYPEIIEGRQSEQVPVTHKQNILKEKWYVTKSSDNERFD